MPGSPQAPGVRPAQKQHAPGLRVWADSPCPTALPQARVAGCEPHVEAGLGPPEGFCSQSSECEGRGGAGDIPGMGDRTETGPGQPTGQSLLSPTAGRAPRAFRGESVVKPPTTVAPTHRPDPVPEGTPSGSFLSRGCQSGAPMEAKAPGSDSRTPTPRRLSPALQPAWRLPQALAPPGATSLLVICHPSW